MRTDSEIFEKIKNSLELKPRVEFIKESKQILNIEAQKINKQHKSIRNTKYALAVAISLTLVLWVSFFNGTQFVVNSYNYVLSSISQNKGVSSPADNAEPTVYIYQTHNRESFTPLLDTDEPDKMYHKDKNISLVGKRIAEILETKGINVLHDNTDIMQTLENKGLEFGESYMISRELVKNTLDKHNNIKLVLDIHRDSRDRRVTTTELNGKHIPNISFVVSQNNSNYNENLKVAELFHEKLQEKYPGVSRGIVTKKGPSSGTYNQDLSESSLLIEIGGIDNTLEEEYKGAEILSDVIIDVLKELE